jgi:hypothetical protein
MGSNRLDDVPPSLEPGGGTRLHGGEQMMVWPAVTLLGFLVLTALVIAMGTRSTARYEAERAEVTTRSRRAATEPARVAA